MGKTKDKIPGGLADKTKKKFDKDQLRKGIKVEMEHTDDPALAREIAKDHLMEDPKYYDHLIEMEKKVEKKKEKKKKAYIFADLFWKAAQVGTPNITIQPGRPEANCALEILKRWDPNYFMNVKEIIIGPSADYGHVESGPDKDPSVIYINADRIVAETGGQQSGRAAALACAKVIAHEKGHVGSYKDQSGFEGGELPAEQEETAFENWLSSGGLQQVEALPCFQGLS
jgi:hypothetical protein